jgi:hypothetical protein
MLILKIAKAEKFEKEVEIKIFFYCGQKNKSVFYVVNLNTFILSSQQYLNSFDKQGTNKTGLNLLDDIFYLLLLIAQNILCKFKA